MADCSPQARILRLKSSRTGIGSTRPSSLPEDRWHPSATADGVVVPLIDDLPPANFAHIDRVLDDVEHRPIVPLLAAALAVAGVIELVADRAGAFLPEGVHLKHLLDHDRLVLVDHEALVRVELVAVGHAAAHEVAALRLPLHPDLGTLEDGLVLELSEDAQHLEHHLPGRVRPVERLRDALERDAVLGELVHHLGQPPDVAGEAVHAEDREGLEGLGLRVVEHLLEAGPVHVGARLGIAVEIMEPPVVVPLRLAEGFEPLLQRVERVLLVVLVGRDAGVESDPPRIAVLVTQRGFVP